MANITAKMVAELRAKTGAGMMDCKKALAETGGNRTHAAKLLEISLRSLIYKIKDYDIQ